MLMLGVFYGLPILQQIYLDLTPYLAIGAVSALFCLSARQGRPATTQRVPTQPQPITRTMRDRMSSVSKATLTHYRSAIRLAIRTRRSLAKMGIGMPSMSLCSASNCRAEKRSGSLTSGHPDQ